MSLSLPPPVAHTYSSEQGQQTMLNHYPGNVTKVLEAQVGMGFTYGGEPKGILLSGQNVKIGFKDQYGNGVTVESNSRASVVMLPLVVNEVTQISGVGAGKNAYILF